MSKEDNTKRRKALESGRGTKTNRKRVAENITNEYLDRQAQKLRDVASFVDYNKNEKYGLKLLYREMKTLERKK
jgi:hypothetical protein